MSEKKLYGYAGKIARIDLTEMKIDIIPTSTWVPEYIGGRQVCHKIFWDEVKPGTKAFDPENKLIFMTGATAGTGIPSGSRAFMSGISPSTYPEQYSFGSIGGWVGAEIKYAGFDGFILQGKAEKPCYVLIDNGKAEILPADGLWGLLVHPAQEWLKEKHGLDTRSMVIGPAGEHLCRDATITTNGDNAFAKSGFGAVMGSKNFKGLAIKGKGAVTPADPAAILKMRERVGGGMFRIPNPIVHQDSYVMISQEGEVDGMAQVEGGINFMYSTCSAGCAFRCHKVEVGIPSAFVEDKKVNQVEKCISGSSPTGMADCDFPSPVFIHSEKNQSFCKLMLGQLDVTDPDLPKILSDGFPGNKTNYFKDDYTRGFTVMQLCNEYGLDKYDVCVWLQPWLGMCKQMGLLDELDFGMEPDVENIEFMKHLLKIWTYREGIGDVFAEGMARAVRILGEDKFMHSIFKGVTSSVTGQQLDVPVSLHSAWGHGVHWIGRGRLNSSRWVSLSGALVLMLNTHNAMGSAHSRVKAEELDVLRDPNTRDAAMIKDAVFSLYGSEIKDMVTACEWTSPNLYWPEMESEMYTAATGIAMDPETLRKQAVRSQLLHRAIIMRNFNRTRDMEVEEVFPILTYPDSFGEVIEWDYWNDLADMLYDELGWDKKTGWPTRERWEEAGLSDVAEELEKLGMIPDVNAEYTRKPNPFESHKKVR